MNLQTLDLERRQKKMSDKRTLKLVFTGLLAAMACVATMVIKIPIAATGGYINLGDCIVLVSGVVLGPACGALAAGIGSALADVLSGYVIYAPATFFIKAAMALLVGWICKDREKTGMARTIIAGALAECVMVGGYFVIEAFVMGYGLGAAAGIIGNLIQGIAGLVIAVLLLPVIRKACAELHRN